MGVLPCWGCKRDITSSNHWWFGRRGVKAGTVTHAVGVWGFGITRCERKQVDVAQNGGDLQCMYVCTYLTRIKLTTHDEEKMAHKTKPKQLLSSMVPSVSNSIPYTTKNPSDPAVGMQPGKRRKRTRKKPKSAYMRYPTVVSISVYIQHKPIIVH